MAYHFIGIGGIGMSALARLLLSKKIDVSGSDLAFNATIEKLMQEGAVIYRGHAADHIASHMTVVYTTGINVDNVEYAAAIHQQCALIHRSDLLRQLIEPYHSLAVTGTHGKTTTSALLASVLMQADLESSFAVGGILPQFQTNAHLGLGKYFAFEADESDRSFLKYSPFGALITNIDRDHLEYYNGNPDQLSEAFSLFASQVQSVEHLFWCNDSEPLRKLGLPGQCYGFHPDSKWKIYNFRQKKFTIYFDVEVEDQHYYDVEVHAIGSYNALNAVAVFAMARTLGIDENMIRKAFKEFKGVMRRCEKKGEMHGVLFLDDYAHHPTEIQVTLQAIRQEVQENRLIAIFQPHRYSRTLDCLGSYGPIFENVDQVFITDIYSSGETPIPHLTSNLIVQEIATHSTVPIEYVPRSALSHRLAQFVRPHDVVVTLGAGDITKVGPEICSYLEKQSPQPLKVGLIFGGSITEHKISISSAQFFREALKSDYYEVEEFGITPQGKWINGPDTQQKLEKILDQPSCIDQTVNLTSHLLQQLLACDVLLPILHGPFGEDGTIQGFFEMLGKPYMGCNHRAAAICMDKKISKQLALLHGLKTSPSVAFSHVEWRQQYALILQRIEAQLVFPVFVKPLHLGSTVGVVKAEDEKQLKEAIEHAFRFDTDLLVENGIVGREIEFAVLGNDDVQVFPPGEILTEGEVYDYAAKYSENSTISATPCADLPSDLIEEGKKSAAIAYKAFGCQGLARIDFFLDDEGRYWFNEANPFPGFTPSSLYPLICAQHGLNASTLVDQLIRLALQRWRQQNRVNHATV